MGIPFPDKQHVNNTKVYHRYNIAEMLRLRINRKSFNNAVNSRQLELLMKEYYIVIFFRRKYESVL